MKRFVSSIAAVALLLGGVALGGVATAAAAAAPTITITPNTGLINGQKVVITGSGFTPGASLAAVECIITATNTTGCSISSPVLITINADGTLPSTNFYVQTGTIGNGTCGTSSADAMCAIAVGTTTGTVEADGPITFVSGPSLTVTPSTGLTNSQKVVLTGSGITPGASLAAVQCIAAATSAAGCTTSPVLITANADGTLPSTSFTVVTGAVGTGTCGTSTADAKCAIAVATTTGTPEANASITFAVASATAPSLTVTPSTGLKNGQAVAVTGAGFTPSDSVYIIECLTTATSSAGCNVAGATPAKVNADGTLPSTSFTVATGAVGTGTCGTSTSNLSSCAITVANATGGDAGAAPITFASLTVARSFVVKPQTRLRNGELVKVSGVGFTANDHVYIVECLAGATSAAKCDLKTLKAATISATGVLRATNFKVVTGKIGTGKCGTKKSNLNSCAISVANASKGDSKATRITFAMPKK